MTASSSDGVPPKLGTGRLAHVALLLSLSFVLSRVLGVVRQVAIAGVFGDSRAVEAYFTAFRIPDTMFTLVSGGALATAFIPVFAGLLARGDEDEAWHVASSVFNAVAIVLAALAVLAFLFAPLIMGALDGAGYTPTQRALSVDLARIMLLQPIFLGVAAIISAVLQTYARFVLTAIAPLVYNVAVIVGALLGHRFGIVGLSWAVVIGAVLQVAIQAPGIWPEVKVYYRRGFDSAAPGVREIGRLFVPRVVGLAAFQGMLFITFFLANRLPAGMLGAINYSWLLVLFPVGALGTAAATAVFPQWSRLNAANDHEAVRRSVNRGLRLILFLALPAAAGLMVLRRPIVILLYAHGNTWTSQATEDTAFALLVYALALAPLTAIEILPRVFYSMRDTRTPVRVAVAAVVIDAILSVLFVHLLPATSGQGGLALATAIATTVQALWLGQALGERLGGIGSRSIRGALRDGALASLSMAVVLYVTLDLLTAILPQRSFGVLLTVLVEVPLGVGVFVLVAYLLGAPELWQARELLRRSDQRNGGSVQGAPPIAVS